MISPSGDIQPDLWFFGTGTFAAECLENLSDHLLFSLVVTSPPSRGGRGLSYRPSPVEQFCTSRSLPLCSSPSVSADEKILSLLARRPPLSILVVDFGQKIKEPLLSAPLWGCLNIHPSLLPRYRGAAPVQRALMEGENPTGVTLFRLTEGMDEGPILLQRSYSPGEEETAGEVLSALAQIGSELYLLGVKCMIEGTCKFTPQDSEFATNAPKISPSEGEIVWSRPAGAIADLVRSLNPAPGAFFLMNSKRIKVWKALRARPSGTPGTILDFHEGRPLVAAGRGSLELHSVQPEGKKRLDGADWARGLRLKKGDVLL